jgi:phosphate acetyltransferase
MNASPDQDWVENHVFEEIQLGQSAQLIRTLTAHDILAFAAVSGDTNPAHLDEAYAMDTPFKGIIAHGMWSAALISALLGAEFPGPGTIYMDQSLHFSRPVRVGDTLTVKVTVAALDPLKKTVTLDCEVSNQKSQIVVSGQAKVLAPASKVRRFRVHPPTLQLLATPQAAGSPSVV